MQEYLELLKNPAHWLFEITVEIVIGGIVLSVIWPKIKQILEHLDKHK